MALIRKTHSGMHFRNGHFGVSKIAGRSEITRQQQANVIANGTIVSLLEKSVPGCRRDAPERIPG